MHMRRSTAGRKEDVRDKTSRLVLKADSDEERRLLTRVADMVMAGTLYSLLFERCKCGHSFEEHEQPETDISWDVCDFPCQLCACSVFFMPMEVEA